jgi:hypothetical protein
VALRDNLDTDLFKRALLQLVYWLLFWFVAEDRDVISPQIPARAPPFRRPPAVYMPSHEVKAARESVRRRSRRASMRTVSRTCGW